MNGNKVARIVLICDCHDFSKVHLELGEEILDFMDSFYRVGGECIVAAGGRIIKYMGDAMVAIFPADAVGAAVDAARCLRREYMALVSTAGITVETDMEVGLSCGDLYEGEVGHDSLRCFDIAGECVNEAARICHHRGIAVTDTLKQELPPDTPVRQLEPYPIKWRDEPLIAWEIVEE